MLKFKIVIIKSLLFLLILNTSQALAISGKEIKELIKDFNEKVFFIDDLAHQISSVKEEVSRSKTIHYISDERLSKLAVSPKEADFRAYSWKDIYNFLINEVSG